ncbi:MAG: dihydropyrimidinase [Planctomycetota bacterium]
MQYDTIIANGTVVNADRSFKADVAIKGEKIARIGKGLVRTMNPDGTRIIDAKGCYVIPGGVDVHVHLALPFCGTTSSDDYNTGTRAAARGGVTTVVDFAIPYGDESLHKAVDNWMAKAEGKACVDYTFHVAVTKWNRHKHEMESIVKRGLPTFKQFMIYEREGWQADDAAIFGALEKCRELDGMLLIHAESSRVLDELIARHHTEAEMKKYGARLHGITRPNYIEEEAIQRALKWAEVTGGRLYIVHMSTREGTELVKAAHKRGMKNVFAETCAQYLVLDDSVFGEQDGHLYACCPQLKKRADQTRLWKGLKDDTVCAVSTDTCTFTRQQKAMWQGDWTKIPMGMPGLETLLPIVYTHGVLKKRLSINEFVDKCSTTPARIMGLGERKGVIKAGYDADLAVIHPTKKIKVDPKHMETNADWSPYDGWALAGFARTTLCRGRVVCEDYKFCGKNGWGRFLPRKSAGHL